MSGTPFSALAFHMAKNGLDTTIYHENIDLFSNENGMLNNTDFELTMKEYKKYLVFAEKRGAKILNGINITTDLLKEKLKEGKSVILAGEIYDCYHAILLTGYDEKVFKICDPSPLTQSFHFYYQIHIISTHYTELNEYCCQL